MAEAKTQTPEEKKAADRAAERTAARKANADAARASIEEARDNRNLEASTRPVSKPTPTPVEIDMARLGHPPDELEDDSSGPDTKTRMLPAEPGSPGYQTRAATPATPATPAAGRPTLKGPPHDAGPAGAPAP